MEKVTDSVLERPAAQEQAVCGVLVTAVVVSCVVLLLLLLDKSAALCVCEGVCCQDTTTER